MSEQRYIYEIDDQLAIRAWDTQMPNEENKPFLYQPDHPDGRPWVDRNDAEQWINSFIVEMLKPAAEEPELIEEESEIV